MDNSTEETRNTEISSLTYEEAFANLESVVASLESGELPLEKSLSLYEQGKLLAQHCQKLLEQAELHIRVLSEEQPIPQVEE